MDILVIEGGAPRRISVAQHLLRATYRVTICSSIEEAREILQFIAHKTDALDVVIIGERLLSRDTTNFREEISDRFPGILWVPLSLNLSLLWLGDWLRAAAARTAVSPVAAAGGDGVTFFLGARRRFPRAKRIASGAREEELTRRRADQDEPRGYLSEQP